MKKNSQNFTIEWREHGRWVMSVNSFDSKRKAEEHAGIIGAKTVRIRKLKKTHEERKKLSWQ